MVWAGMRSIQSISVIVSAGMEELITASHTLVEAQWGKQEVVVLVNQAERACQNDSFHSHSNVYLISLSQNDYETLGKVKR